MKVEAKGYKKFHGHDGQGFEVSIYVDGKRTARIFDDGWGGEWQYTIFNQELLDALTEKVTALDPHVYEYNDEDEAKSFTVDMSLDIWLDEHVIPLAEFRSARKVFTRDEQGKFFEWDVTYKKAYRENLIKKLAKSRPTHQMINGNKASVELS